MLSYFIIKIEAYDVEAFVREIENLDPNGVLLVVTYAGEIFVRQCPPTIPLKPKYLFFRKGSLSENLWLKWPSYFWQITKIMGRVLWNERVDRFIIEGGDIILWIAHIFKRLGRIRRTYTIFSDWSPLSTAGDTLLRLNVLKAYLNDLFLNRANTTVLVTTKEIFEERNRYWKNKTLRNSRLVENYWARLLEKNTTLDMNPNANKICFLGNVRRNFGMEALFEALPGLNREFGIRLKVIGPETRIYQEYKDLAERQGVHDLIEWRGFVPLNQFPQELEDCFCGVNTQELEVNTGRFAIAGRVVNYLQYLIPSIVTPQSGAIVKFIRDFDLGVICDCNASSLKAAILKCRADRLRYVQNIERFLKENPYHKSFAEILDGARNVVELKRRA